MGQRRQRIGGRTRRFAFAATGAALMALGCAALIAWPARSPATLAELRSLSAAQDHEGALMIAARLLARAPSDAILLRELGALYDRLCDLATGAPDPGRAGNAARSIVISLSDAYRDGRATPAQAETLALYALMSGQYGRAAAVLRRAAQHGIDPDRARTPLALALLQDRAFEDLLAEVDAKSGRSPREKALLWTLRARAEAGLGQVAAARAAFRAALAAMPNHADTLSRFGQMELWYGGREAAAGLLARARAAAPDATPTLVLAAEYAYATGDYAASAQTYDALTRRGVAEIFDPIPPSLGKARALIYRNELAAAAAALNASPLGARDPSVAYYRALLAYRAGKFGEAASLGQGLDARLPGYPPLDLLVGGAMLATGFHDTATARLQRYLVAVPGNSFAQALLRSAERRVKASDAGPELDRHLQAAFGFPAARGTDGS